jgi:hypothetical protein
MEPLIDILVFLAGLTIVIFTLFSALSTFVLPRAARSQLNRIVFAVLDQLDAAGVPLKADREQVWLDFAGWRVNYDRSLILLCGLVMAPKATWSSDRAP